MTARRSTPGWLNGVSSAAAGLHPPALHPPALADQPVVFLKEPDNEFDPNAVAVLTLDGRKLGYIPRDESRRFLLDACFGFVASMGATHSEEGEELWGFKVGDGRGRGAEGEGWWVLVDVVGGRGRGGDVALGRSAALAVPERAQPGHGTAEKANDPSICRHVPHPAPLLSRTLVLLLLPTGSGAAQHPSCGGASFPAAALALCAADAAAVGPGVGGCVQRHPAAIGHQVRCWCWSVMALVQQQLLLFGGSGRWLPLKTI